jgi:DNA-binding NarL/FixJ family response regulator
VNPAGSTSVARAVAQVLLDLQMPKARRHRRDRLPAEGRGARRAAARGQGGRRGRLAAGASCRAAVAEARTERQPVEDLTEREREVLRLVAEGLPNKLIARRLEISEKP